MPGEGAGVFVTAVGPSGRKAIYSDYGIEQAAATWRRRAATRSTWPRHRRGPTPKGRLVVRNRVLAPSTRAARARRSLAAGEIDADGAVTPKGRLVVRATAGTATVPTTAT